MSDPVAVLADQFQAFPRLVADMRAAQKAYFRRRVHPLLMESKALEAKVDHYLAEFEGTPGLFDEEQPHAE